MVEPEDALIDEFIVSDFPLLISISPDEVKEMALFIIKSLSIVKTPKETFSLAFGNVPLPKIDPDLTCQYIPVPEINPLISDEVPFPYT